jgi:hypothetical protein
MVLTLDDKFSSQCIATRVGQSKKGIDVVENHERLKTISRCDTRTNASI